MAEYTEQKATPAGDYSEIRKQLLARHTQLDNDRQKHLPDWIDLRDYVLPEHGFNLSGADGEEQKDGRRRDQKIIDNTAGQACLVLAAGLQSGVTSPSRPWFRLTLNDPALMEFKPVKVWLEMVEDQIRYVLNKSNAYRSFHHVYTEMPVFGTAAQIILEDSANGVYCRPFTAGEYWLGVDHRLRVNTFHRRIWMTAAQMIEEFGKANVSHAVVQAYDNNSGVLWEVLHVIEPNDDRLDAPGARGKAFRSIYMEKACSEGKLLRVGGFETFPVQAPRWDVVGGKVYGYGPGRTCIGDTKMLQSIVTRQLNNLDKAMTPPLKAPSSLKNEVINTVPGGISFADELSGRDTFGPLYTVPVLLNEAEAVANGVRNRIERGYFKDLFLMLAQMPKNNMTATEVAQRHEEKLLMLGPVLERLDSEMLNPVIDRVFHILLREGMLPEPPQEIQGQELKVEYISILAQAQKLIGVTNLQQFSGFVGSLMAVHPEVADKLDFDQLVDEYGDRVGASPKVIRSDEEVAQLRAQRAQQQQQQQAMQMAAQMAEGAKTLSQADMSGNNALSTLMGSGALNALTGGAPAK